MKHPPIHIRRKMALIQTIKLELVLGLKLHREEGPQRQLGEQAHVLVGAVEERQLLVER